MCLSLLDWISDTHSQECTDQQSLMLCLDHGDIVAQYAVQQGCVRLRDALKCISEAIVTVMVRTCLWPHTLELQCKR